MVKQSSDLDAVFHALADPTRRGILEQLAGGRTRVTDLAEPFDISLPAVSKHLRVLEDAGFVTRTRVGREHRIGVDPRPAREARAWMERWAVHWEDQFDRLAAWLERVQAEEAEATDDERPAGSGEDES